MKTVYERFGYIADPHTAVGVLGWEAYNARRTRSRRRDWCWRRRIRRNLRRWCSARSGLRRRLPARLAAYLKREKLSVPMSSGYDEFKQFLLEH